MIPQSEYKTAPGIGSYITFDQIKKYHSAQESDDFIEWMSGQTCSGVYENETWVSAIYVDDYERWLRQGKQTEQGADWD